jgi:hypothetical protein
MGDWVSGEIRPARPDCTGVVYVAGGGLSGRGDAVAFDNGETSDTSGSDGTARVSAAGVVGFAGAGTGTSSATVIVRNLCYNRSFPFADRFPLYRQIFSPITL